METSSELNRSARSMVRTPTPRSTAVRMCVAEGISRSLASARPRARREASGRGRCRGRSGPRCSARQVPTTAALRPRGCLSSAAITRSSASGRTPSTALPSLATCSGSMPRISEAARTSSESGTACSSSSTPTPLFSAISCSALARPPRVGSFIATTPSPAAPSTCADQPVQRGHVGAEVALELQLLAGSEHGEPVVSDGPGDDDPISGPQPAVADQPCGRGRPRWC